MDITENSFDAMTKTNLRGPLFCIQEALPNMVKNKWGRVVNIVSLGGQLGGVNQIHYACAKAGLIGLTRSIALSFSNQGVTCNAVSPGLIKTDMSKREISSKSGINKVRLSPIGRLGQPDEVAGAVAYLVSEEASYVTGQTLNVNGGMYFG